MYRGGVDVKCGSTVLPLPLVVVSTGASLLGLNWIEAFQLDINALLYTPKASAELPSANVHTVGVPTDLETSIGTCFKACNVCAVTAPAPAVNLSPWPLPDEPWDRIHVDFTGPLLGKWPSVVRMPN